MSPIWIGYGDVMFIKASLVRSERYTELARDRSGLPVFYKACLVYVDPTALHALREHAHEHGLVGHGLRVVSDEDLSRADLKQNHSSIHERVVFEYVLPVP